ncbi:glycosyltransferase family 2 protein, partial [Nautilia sp.]
SVSSAIKKPLKYFYLTKKELQTLSDKEKKKIFSNLINFNKNQYYSLVFIQNEENKGFAAGNNKALELLLNEKKEGFIFLLNPDMVLTQDTISNLVECAVDKNAVYGLNVFDYHNPDQLLFKGGASLTPYGTIRFIKKAKDFEKLDYISGGAFFTHIENFRKVGLLPEEYFLYWEETDWCVKARKVGIKLKVCENAKCFDKGGVSIGRGSFLSEYYYTLNSLKFHKKYFPTKVKKIKIFSFARIAKRIIKGKFLLVKAIIKALKDFENEK